jgi:dephospho-CoA kinase
MLSPKKEGIFFRMKTTKVIGLTGGIGAGKSVVASVFATFGVPVYDSDAKAKSLLNTDAKLEKEISELLGKNAYLNGFYNATFVAEKVFSDTELLSKLNQLVHPAVERDFEYWKSEQESSLVLKETALLFQTDLWRKVDFKVLVLAPENLRIQRVALRDTHRSLAQIQLIIEKQGRAEEHISKADFVIHNDDKQAILEQVRFFLNKIVNNFS